MRLIRRIGILVVVVSVAWIAAGVVYAFGFLLAAGYSPNDWQPWGALLLLGTVLGFFGAMGGAVLFGAADSVLEERRWRNDLRHGTVTIHNPRPGLLYSSGTQELICEVEIRVSGMATIRADYKTKVGPADAPRLVEGATFECQVSPNLPERVRVWLVGPPDPSELTGHYRDFQPVRSAPRAERPA